MRPTTIPLIRVKLALSNQQSQQKLLSSSLFSLFITCSLTKSNLLECFLQKQQQYPKPSNFSVAGLSLFANSSKSQWKSDLMLSLLQFKASGYFLVSWTTFFFKNARSVKINARAPIKTIKTTHFLQFIFLGLSYRFSQMILEGSGASLHSNGISRIVMAD